MPGSPGCQRPTSATSPARPECWTPASCATWATSSGSCWWPACVHQARVRARDDLAEMFCKRMATIHKNGRELLAEIQERHRERSERMISVFGHVLAAAREAQTQEGDDWRLRFGIEAATVLDDAGGLEELATEHEELSAHHGNNYLPLLA